MSCCLLETWQSLWHLHYLRCCGEDPGFAMSCSFLEPWQSPQRLPSQCHSRQDPAIAKSCSLLETGNRHGTFTTNLVVAKIQRSQCPIRFKILDYRRSTFITNVATAKIQRSHNVIFVSRPLGNRRSTLPPECCSGEYSGIPRIGSFREPCQLPRHLPHKCRYDEYSGILMIGSFREPCQSPRPPSLPMLLLFSRSSSFNVLFISRALPIAAPPSPTNLVAGKRSSSCSILFVLRVLAIAAAPSPTNSFQFLIRF